MKKQINIEIDSAIKRVIERLCEKGNITVTQWMTQAIMNYIPYFERGINRQKKILEEHLTARDMEELQWEKYKEVDEESKE